MNDGPALPSPRRFDVLGGPGGYLSARYVGALRPGEYVATWQRLVRVNVPRRMRVSPRETHADVLRVFGGGVMVATMMHPAVRANPAEPCPFCGCGDPLASHAKQRATARPRRSSKRAIYEADRDRTARAFAEHLADTSYWPARWVYGGETRQHTPEEQTEVQRIRETFAARAAGYELYADSHNKAEWRKVA